MIIIISEKSLEKKNKQNQLNFENVPIKIWLPWKHQNAKN